MEPEDLYGGQGAEVQSAARLFEGRCKRGPYRYMCDQGGHRKSSSPALKNPEGRNDERANPTESIKQSQTYSCRGFGTTRPGSEQSECLDTTN
jgi:hypothetical protein